MPIAHERRWSVEDVWALPHDPHQRYETVDGDLLVSPMPPFAHQRAVSRLGLMLGESVQRQRVGEMMCAPYDVVLDPFTLMQPGVLVIAPVGLDVVRGEVAPPPPYLAVEVRSSRWRGPIACGSGHGTSAPRSSAGQLAWQPAGAEEPLGVDVEALLLAILGADNDGAGGTTVQP